MAAQRLVRIAPHDDALAIGNLVFRAARIVYRLAAAVACEHSRENLRLNHALPEGAELLMADHAHHVGVALSEIVDRAGEQLGALPGVRVEECENLAVCLARTGRTCPLLAKPI